MKKTVYLLLVSEVAFNLAAEVSRHLADGWVLYGSPSVTGYDKYCIKYIQAVIREEPI